MSRLRGFRANGPEAYAANIDGAGHSVRRFPVCCEQRELPMRRYGALILLFVLAAARGSIGAESEGVAHGQTVPESESRRSASGFSGWLIVTPDQDWEAKWNTPAERTPHFNTAKDVRMGETLTVLIFYSSPHPTTQGEIAIRCDLRVTRPDGTRSVDARTSTVGPESSRVRGRICGCPDDCSSSWGKRVTPLASTSWKSRSTTSTPKSRCHCARRSRSCASAFGSKAPAGHEDHY